MSTSSYSGTHTQKIDKLITDVVEIKTTLVEIKTTLRMCAWMIGISLPFLVALNIFLVARAYDNSGKLDRLSDRIDRIDRAVEKLHEQSDKGKQ